MFSPDELKIAVRFITKLRNAAKFTVARLEGYDGNKPKIILPVDEWLLERCKTARIKASNFLNEYESGSARHEIDEFFWKDFCDNYLELIKDRLYNPQLHGEAARQSASYGLYYGFLEIIKLYAPFVPHITEAIYQHYYRQYEGAVSLHTMCWSTKTDENKILIIGGEALKLVLFELRRYKSEHSLSHKSDIGDVTVTSPNDVVAFLQAAVEDIKSCCSARSIIIISGEKLEVTVN
jgi:valyl-tRNA synthetase